MTWELIWKVVLIAVLAIFGIMAVLVSILGARDIKRLLIGLRDQDDDDEEQAGSKDPSGTFGS